MADIKEALEYAKKNPNTPFAQELRKRIESGKMNTELETAGLKPVATGAIGGIVQDIKETGSAIASAIGKGAQKGQEALMASVNNPQGNIGTDLKAIGQAVGSGLGGFANASGEALVGAGKVLLPQGAEDAVAQTVQDVATPIIESAPVKGLMEKYNTLDEDTKRSIDAVLGVGSFITELTGLGLGAKAVSKGANIAEQAVEGAVDATKTAVSPVTNAVEGAVDTIFGKEVKSIDDVIKQADEALTPADKLSAVEGATAKPSIFQKWAGVSPDIKNRIAGKKDQLKEYFDVAHARNNLDTLPTPLEYGANKVQAVVNQMEGLLNETGSKIGSFRRKIGSYKASIDDVTAIESEFIRNLDKLNLELKDGVVRKKAGTVSRVNSDAEVNALNDLYSEMRTIKEAPDLQRLIDLRNLFDSKINFAKSTRDVSSSLDPLSRNVRKAIADVSARIVGKTEAGNLQKYSEFMDAYTTLRGFTDRKAGAEFLLKQSLSERGRLPREAMNTIKEFTGVDLMDDALMASLATDLIGNIRQKGQFRQELTKAGLDVESALRGDSQGIINLILRGGKKLFVNEEEQFLKAAEVPNAPKKKVNSNGSEAYGAVSGFEQDEEGNLSYDPLKGAIGTFVAGGIRKIKPAQAVDTFKDIASSIKSAKASGKNFDQWVKTQGNAFHRATVDAFDENKLKKSGKGVGVYVTPDANVAKTFLDDTDAVSRGEKRVMESLVVSPDAKILRNTDFPKNLKWDYQGGTLNAEGLRKLGGAQGRQDKIAEFAIKNGYDVIVLGGDDSYRIIVNPKVVKTEKQLKSEWDSVE